MKFLQKVLIYTLRQTFKPDERAAKVEELAKIKQEDYANTYKDGNLPAFDFFKDQAEKEVPTFSEKKINATPEGRQPYNGLPILDKEKSEGWEIVNTEDYETYTEDVREDSIVRDILKTYTRCGREVMDLHLDLISGLSVKYCDIERVRIEDKEPVFTYQYKREGE